MTFKQAILTLPELDRQWKKDFGDTGYVYKKLLVLSKDPNKNSIGDYVAAAKDIGYEIWWVYDSSILALNRYIPTINCKRINFTWGMGSAHSPALAIRAAFIAAVIDAKKKKMESRCLAKTIPEYPGPAGRKDEMHSCEMLKCKWWDGQKCTDPQEYRNANGENVCGRREDAIPHPSPDQELTDLQKQLAEKGEYGYSQQVVDALTKERDSLQAQLAAERECYDKLERTAKGRLARLAEKGEEIEQLKAKLAAAEERCHRLEEAGNRLIHEIELPTMAHRELETVVELWKRAVLVEMPAKENDTQKKEENQ